MQFRFWTWKSAVVAVAVIPIAVLAIARQQSFNRVARTDQSLPQTVYVWQRAWSSAVREAVARETQSSDFDLFLVLAAEVKLGADQPKSTSPDIDWSVVPRGAGLVIRINGTSPFVTRDGEKSFSAIALIACRGIVHRVLLNARDHQHEPLELQIDFDCPSSKLEAYDQLLDVVRDQLRIDSPTSKLSITALPSWFGQSAFVRIAKKVDGCVLQIHSIRAPSSFDEPATLCDANEARQLVERFAALGVPFRVSLPTYTYEVGFDPAGKRVGVRAEMDRDDWSPDTRIRSLAANAAELAKLVHDLQHDRPANLVGLCWFRLPVDGDRLNWSSRTLHSVMHGERPRPELVVSIEHDSAGAMSIVLTNHGNAAAPLDHISIRAVCAGTGILAADALNHARVIEQSSNAVTFLTASSESPIAPDEQRAIGWIRLAGDIPSDQVRVAIEPGEDHAR